MEVFRGMNVWLNRARIVFQYVYETRVAPFLATYIWFAWLPVYVYAKKNNICFVINIAEGTGQVLPELDNFFLQLDRKEIDPTKKYVWIRGVNDFSRALIPLYGKKFHVACMSNVLYNLLLPALLRWHDITHDAGMAGLHWQLPKSGTWQYPKPWQTYLYIDSKTEVLARWRRWYERRLQVNDSFVLDSPHLAADKQLLHFLGADTKKIVLLHIKTSPMNATAAATDPKTYIPTIEYLLAEGYRLVFVGRERMPEAFHAYGVLNYANSPIASFLHDMQLFNLAEFSITGGSGIAWIADCLRKPVVYLNSWHIFMPPANGSCVYVPALVMTAQGSLLSFRDQFSLYEKTAFSSAGDVFPFGDYTPQNADAEDILVATQELKKILTSNSELSALQKTVRAMGTNGWTEQSQSRMSQAFIEKYKNLLD